MNLKFLPETSGISAMEIELIIVPGIEISGITIPVKIPKKLMASVSGIPILTNMAGNSKEMSSPTMLDPIRITAMGADVEIKDGIILMFGFIFPPFTK